jgi:hypothetical protein
MPFAPINPKFNWSDGAIFFDNSLRESAETKFGILRPAVANKLLWINFLLEFIFDFRFIVKVLRKSLICSENIDILSLEQRTF